MARFRPIPLHIVDGFARGPDGEMLSPFARFADRFMRGGVAEAPAEGTSPHAKAQPIPVISNGVEQPLLIREDGSVTVLELVEVKNDRD